MQPRFVDLDINFHLNNVAMMGLFQEGRVRFHTQYAGSRVTRTHALIVASFTVDFIADGLYPGNVDVASGITTIGRTSHSLVQLMTQSDRAVAVASATMVRALDGKPVVNDPEFTSAMQSWLMKS